MPLRERWPNVNVVISGTSQGIGRAIAERFLAEDVHATLENLRSHQKLLVHTEEAVAMADELFELTVENYAHGLCDINTYSLAQNRRDNAYNQHLTALARYWTTYYHLLTLTQYE